MSEFAKRLSSQLGLEGKTPLDAPVTEHMVDVDCVPVIADQCAAAILEEARQDSNNLTNEIVTIDELHEMDDHLETLSDTVDQAVESGEVSAATLDMAAVAIEQVMRNMSPTNPFRMQGAWGLIMGDKAKLNPSNETTRSRLSLGIEFGSGIKEAAANFWRWIKDQLRKVFAFFKKWYLKTMDSFVRLKKRAQAVMKRAEDTQGSPKEKSFDSSLLVQLHINKKCPAKPEDIVLSYKELSENLAATVGESNKVLEELADTDLTDPIKVEALVKEAVESITKSELYKEARKSGGNKSTDTRFSQYYAFEQTEGFFGDMMFVAGFSLKGYGLARSGIHTAPKDNAGKNLQEGQVTGIDATATGANLPKFTKLIGGFFPVNAVKNSSPDGAGKMDTLAIASITGLCENIVEICDNVAKYKANWQKRDQIEAKMKSLMQRAEKEAEKADKDSKAKTLLAKNFAKASVNMLTATTTIETNTVQHFGSKLNFVLDWCSASLNQYTNS